ncbi:MAG: MFS transporter [Saprospiraceae bacterium]|nr:MFS transporter [Saprospiraceae bacterium]
MFLQFYRHWRSSYAGIPRAIWFLALVNLVNRCGSMVIAFITIYLTQQLHFNIREAGYVMGFFGAGALVGAFAGGRLTDRVGYYSVQLWSLILNGIMLLLTMLVRDFWVMCATIFILSMVSEVFRPANSVAIARHSTAENRTRSISLYRMSVNMGWTIAPVFGGLLASLGWHWLFWVDGLTCLFAAVMLRRLMSPKAGEKTQAVETDPAAQISPASPYRDRSFLWFVFLTVLNAIVFMQILWTVPVFWKEDFHWSEASIGLMTALNGFMVFAIEMPMIYRLDGRRPQLDYVRVGLILYAVSYLAFNMPFSHFAAALIFTVAISLGEMFVMPFSSNFVFARSAGVRQGQYMALYTMAYSVANILAPLFGTQIIAAWGYATLWNLLAVLACVTWIGFWILGRNNQAGNPTDSRPEVVAEVVPDNVGVA